MLPEEIPGVVQVGSGAKWLTPGGVAAGTKAYVDGVETDFGNFGAPDSVSQPSFESVQEFTANLLTNRAEFGGIGEVNSTTKSGTNAYHASLFEYARNSAFDARNPFLTSKPNQNLHNYGVAGGGPAIRNKTFFYFVFDGTRGVRAYPFTSNVPTLAQRLGDFQRSGRAEEPVHRGRVRRQPDPGQSAESAGARRAGAVFPATELWPGRFHLGQLSGLLQRSRGASRLRRPRGSQLLRAVTPRFCAIRRRRTTTLSPGPGRRCRPQSVGTSTNIRRVNFFTLGDVFSPRRQPVE